MTTKHSKIVGGSSADRVIGCPGSVNLVNSLPPRPSNAFADEGTMLHSVMGLVLDEGKAPESLIGFEELGHELTEELLLDRVIPALEAFDREIDDDAEFVCEAKLNFSDKIPGVFGTADVVATERKYSTILDWKFGFNEVSAKKNSQLMFYACAARHTPAVSDMLPRDRPVRLVIVQPQAHNIVSSDVVTHQELDQFEIRLLNAVRRSKQPEPPMNLGSWCKWCDARTICPLQVEQASQAKGTIVERDDQGVLPTPHELSDLVTLAYNVQDWAAAVLKYAHQELEAGHEVPGYKLIAKRSIRHWIDEEKTIKRLRALRVPAKEYMVRKVQGIGAVEKAMKKNGVDVKKEMARLTEKKSSGVVMAREDNPAPGVLSGQTALKQLAHKLG